MLTTPAVAVLRTVDDRQVPVPGRYAIDRTQTTVSFVARQLLVGQVRGRFHYVRGEITVEAAPERSHVEVEIAVASLDTGNDHRDSHLRSRDFFDVRKFPAMTFTSTRIERASAGGWVVIGDLTIRDVTRPVRLDLSFDGVRSSSDGVSEVSFSATGTVDRDAWGIDWNGATDVGGVVIGRQVRIELIVRALPRRERGDRSA